jgi:hypothetical protein
MPIASAILAASRLIITMMARAVRELDAEVLHANTDSVAVPASPHGGTVDCPNAPNGFLRVRTFDQLREVMARFDPLGFHWKEELDSLPEHTIGIVVGTNKLLLGRFDGDGTLHIVRSSGAGLGGHRDDPTGTKAILPDGRTAWAAMFEECFLREVVGDPDLTHPLRVGELTASAHLLAVRREAATTWSKLLELRQSTGDETLGPFTPVVRVITGGRSGGPVAIDTWANQDDPEAIGSLDFRRDGEPVSVFVRAQDGRSVHVAGDPNARRRVRGLTYAEDFARWLLDNDPSVEGPKRGLRTPRLVVSSPLHVRVI